MSYPQTFTSIFARNCIVKRIPADQARAFLQANHRFGYSRCKYCYGLFIDRMGGGKLDGCGSDDFPIGRMVAVSCFSNARKWIKGDVQIRSYEWVRYASLPQIRVQGGMSKLLKRFIEEVEPDDIMTYAPIVNGDEGQAYALLGFQEEGEKEFENGKSVKYRLKLKKY